jgi:hypothetical protein
MLSEIASGSDRLIHSVQTVYVLDVLRERLEYPDLSSMVMIAGGLLDRICRDAGRTRAELRIPNAAAQTRIVSGGEFLPGQRELSRHLKYMARARLPEFESSQPSQPVQSLRRDFRVCENRRHSRGLG